MEFIESKERYLCLNMIVKNEGHIIKDTLTKLLNKIPSIDYWVISDTGSTDKTKEIIIEFFKERNIQGEIFEDSWKDFGHNRTLALEHAYKKSRFLLVFDADDEICGDFVLPELNKDSYLFQFGDANGTSYTRVQIINNKKKWKYVCVLHEIITCTDFVNGSDIIKGNYYTISGKSGARSLDPNKYQKDALILEKAYDEAVKNNDDLYNRYGFYCANSYYDCGKWEDAIKWYKITLGNKNWDQEKYISCLRLYNCYNALNQKETGFFYLVKSFSYDKERVECLYELVSYYCCNEMNDVAYNYYNITKTFYNERYLTHGLNGKLFLDISKANLFLPYYMILVSDKVKDYNTALQMYKIIFTKKHIERSKHYIGNMLYNLQFFIEHDIFKNDTEFLRLFQEYVEFLISINYPIYDHIDFMVKYEKYGILLPKISSSNFSLDDCLKSKNILLYSGYSPSKWNYTFSLGNALGGSETAIASLTKNFPEDYTIYVAGEVEEETVENIRYVHFNNLNNLIKTTAFHSIIVSRYLNFYELYKNFSAYQTYIWGHDITLFSYGTDLSVESILTKWSSKITGCICQTEWHKNLFLSSFPQLKDKISIINNGINANMFSNTKVKKVTNRFIYTSCSERGLYKLVQLWPSILENLPDAELVISSYNNFPNSSEDNKIQEIINKTPSIKHMGKLNRTQLYDLMSSAEYWLYTSYFQETSCITSLELLASEVICLYYHVAGLVNTLGDYGIHVSEGNEIDALLSLSINKKIELKKKGKEYALSCSWQNRADEWMKLIYNKNQKEETNLQETNLQENFIIKIVNLEKRTDRKIEMISKLTKENIQNYEFFKAINGTELDTTEKIYKLFKHNDFSYKKGVIGCTLSHLHLWNELLHDKNHSFYVILEDDIDICTNFKEHLNHVSDLFVKQNIDHLALGEYSSKKDYPLVSSSITEYKKNLYEEGHVTFAYLISKQAVIKAFDYINTTSIKCAFDNPLAFGYILNYSALSHRLVDCKIDNQYGSDIQNNNQDKNFNFDNFSENNNNTLTISFCDWWESEYCGGNFDVNDNFFTNLLRKYNSENLNIKVVNSHQNPDILFFSIFGDNYKYLNAKRKVFFSGEPVGQNSASDFNITFDPNTLNNFRLPLWICYFDNKILEETERRIQNINKKEQFCSFIASGPGLTNNRKDFVDKLSRYKTVHCGGNYLNNIGGPVPIGFNCSGKVEHNKKYKFAIAFESKNYPGYVTEKICDIFKSNTIPIYWGTSEVIQDFNSKSFINSNDFSNFDELVEFIKKIDNDDILYASYFKEPILSNMWIDILTDPNKVFFKNLVDKIIGSNVNLLNEYFNEINYSNKINDNFRNYIFQYGIDSNKKDITDIIVNILESTKQNFVIPIGDNIRAQIFGDPCWGRVKNIYIYNKNYREQTIIVTENESKIIYFDEKYNYKFVMGFYDNSLSERGTTTMMFSYADYVEKYFKCKSIIFYNKHHHANNNEVINRFNNRFKVYSIDRFEEIEKIIETHNIKYFYNTCGGKRNSTELVKNCKNLIHAVFDIEPFGDIYSAISDYIVKKSKYPDIDAIPYMIDLPIHNDNMRHDLNLPDNAFVIGRIGGYEQFDIKEAHKGIIHFLNNTNNNSTYFVFVNTHKFYEHPQIIYLDKIVDPYLKTKYINTCDTMIHARSDGETFGLAIAEFSSFNKPIITCRSDKDNCHLDILGEKAILFNSDTSLFNILKDIKNIVNSRDDWNAYKEYTPENVMAQFHRVFLSDEEFIPNIKIDYNKINYIDMNNKAPNYSNNKDITIVTSFLDINREYWKSYKRTSATYLESFYNYFSYDTRLIVFIDDKYINEIKEKYNCSKYKKTTFIPINIEWMEQNIYAWKHLEKCKNIMTSESYINLVKDRINNGSPENIYPEYNTINHSKIDFICYAIDKNLISRDDIICWSDFGYFNSILHNNINEYPLFPIDVKKICPNNLTFFLRNKLEKNDEDVIHTLVNAPEKFTGSFFAGPTNLMLELQLLYHESLNELYMNNISDDDQHIYLRCFIKNPNLFKLYLDSEKWPCGLNYFEKRHDKLTLTNMLLSNIKNGNFVEIGCDSGVFSNHILEINSTSTLYSIDPYISYNDYNDSINHVTGDKLYYNTNTFLSQKFGKRFNLIRKFSNQATNDVPNDLDFVYIDGNHSYKYVYEDICMWWEKLGPNGIIIGDDAVDIDETKRNREGNIFIEWMPGCYGDYGVVKAFNDFINTYKCYGQKIDNQFIIFKNRSLHNR